MSVHQVAHRDALAHTAPRDRGDRSDMLLRYRRLPGQERIVPSAEMETERLHQIGVQIALLGVRIARDRALHQIADMTRMALPALLGDSNERPKSRRQ